MQDDQGQIRPTRYEEELKALLAGMESDQFAKYQPISEVDRRCYNLEQGRRQDPNWKPSPQAPPRRVNTTGRIVGGCCLIVFALVGGTNNITRMLPIEVAIQVALMMLFIVPGLILIIKPPKSRD
jgi:hypothetical protein